MAASSSSLDDLRRRIDEIDDRIHDLVIERAETVEAIGRVKRRGGRSALRPGREALILRRLLARHRGRFPRSVVVRLWRELVSGAVMLQGDFSVAVYAPPEAPDYWDLARDHYGSHMPMTAFHSSGEVLRALGEKRAAVGVLPMPADGDAQPWWPALVAGGAPQIVARLPFAGRGNARGESGDAWVVGHAEIEPTGGDRSVFLFETRGELSRMRVIAALRESDLPVTLFAAHEPAGGVTLYLVEIDDWVMRDDARLARALTQLGEQVALVAPLGAYARPLPPAALASNGKG